MYIIKSENDIIKDFFVVVTLTYRFKKKKKYMYLILANIGITVFRKNDIPFCYSTKHYILAQVLELEATL